jgi:GNAT superfamily N-acetyltransferase
MRFILTKSSKSQIINFLRNKGDDRKWFSYLQRLSKARCFIISKLENDKYIEIGFCYFIYLNNNLDCSFYIDRPYRRQGYARKYVSYLIQHFRKIQFTVSEFNMPSISLFDSEKLLKIDSINVNKNNRTYTLAHMKCDI